MATTERIGNDGDTLVGLVEAARITGWSTSTIHRAANDGTLPVAKRSPRGQRKFRRADVEALIGEVA